MRQSSFRSYSRTATVLVVFASLLFLAACGGGGGSSSTPAVSITISPTSATVAAGATQQFTATVSNAASSSVTWYVNGVNGGNASVGTISTSGLYTAPVVAPTPNTVTVSVIPAADTSQSAKATVTIQGSTGVVISPSTANVAAGTTLKFTAAVNGQSSTAVNWQVNGIPNGNSAIGTIDSTGLYTAPAVVPDPATVTVTAVSQADSTQSANASVTITQFSNASLNGSYVFVMNGVDTNGGFQQAGVFTADGNGHITVGTGDFVQGSTTYLNKEITGTYSIDPNSGIGTANLQTGAGPFDLTFVMSGPDYAYFIESDSYGTANGSMQRQDPTALSTTATNGTYVFELSGTQASNPIAAAGKFVANGGTISSGMEDVNDGVSFTQMLAVSGSYTTSANGRFTGQLVTAQGTTPMVFYVVNSSTLRLFSTDTTMQVTGRAEKQTGSFSNATFNGNYVLSSSGSFIGSSSYAPVNTLARFVAKGDTTASGLSDEMVNGAANLQVAFNGSYTVDSNGRLVSTTNDSGGTSYQVAWFVNSQRAFLLFADTGRVENGILEQQAATSFSTTSVDGAFGYSISGVDYSNYSSGEYVGTAGALTADGNGALSIANTTNRMGNITTTASLIGSYGVDGTGRGIASLGDGSNLIFYVVNGSKLYILQTDRFTQISGGAKKQY
jgi:hypothetical protein